jgi:lysophospholipase L1-like esterase
MRQTLLAAAIVLVCAPAQGGETVYGDGTRCACTSSIAALGEPLRQVSQRIARRAPLKIVAIGSSSTQGHGASTPANAYPARLEVHMEQLLPDVPVTVVNLGIGGEEAKQMLARFESQVLPEWPDLVIWQVGSNSALRGRNITDVAAPIGEGVDLLQRRGIDVVLMNAQYAPATIARPRIGDYLMVVDDTARRHRAGLLDRYEIMRRWVSNGAMAIADPLIADGLHHNDLGYDCLARVLAEAIVAAAHDAESLVVTATGSD